MPPAGQPRKRGQPRPYLKNGDTLLRLLCPPRTTTRYGEGSFAPLYLLSPAHVDLAPPYP